MCRTVLLETHIKNPSSCFSSKDRAIQETGLSLWAIDQIIYLGHSIIHHTFVYFFKRDPLSSLHYVSWFDIRLKQLQRTKTYYACLMMHNVHNYIQHISAVVVPSTFVALFIIRSLWCQFLIYFIA